MNLDFLPLAVIGLMGVFALFGRLNWVALLFVLLVAMEVAK